MYKVFSNTKKNSEVTQKKQKRIFEFFPCGWLKKMIKSCRNLLSTINCLRLQSSRTTHMHYIFCSYCWNRDHIDIRSMFRCQLGSKIFIAVGVSYNMYSKHYHKLKIDSKQIRVTRPVSPLLSIVKEASIRLAAVNATWETVPDTVNDCGRSLSGAG